MISARRWRFTLIAGIILLGGWVAVTIFAAINHRSDAGIDQYETKRLRINDQSLFVEIPYTQALQAKGLGERDGLGADRGMMWVYPAPREVSFWMKGMKFALDFIWVRNGQVIGVSANVLPPSNLTDQLQTYHPPAPVDRVIEVNAGYAAAHNISAGTAITEFDF